MSFAVITFKSSDETMASSGEPIGATHVGPSVSELNRCAGRGAVNVTTECARAIVPCWRVIASASAPEGISTDTTGALLWIRNSIAFAYRPVTGGLNPVPRIASTYRSPG